MLIAITYRFLFENPPQNMLPSYIQRMVIDPKTFKLFHDVNYTYILPSSDHDKRSLILSNLEMMNIFS